MKRRARERGIAAITALLLVVVIAAIATALMIGQHMWLRQSQNLKDLAQAELYHQGAMEFAAILLTRDVRDPNSSKSDNLTEDWAKPIPPLPVDGGTITIRIEDAQARFNLNNLVQGGVVVEQQKRMYERLLVANHIEPTLSDALIDWLDADSGAQQNGAEDLDYLNLSPPYRAANRVLTSVDELRLIKGYTEETVEALRPYVTVLPSVVLGTVNVNTAPAPVISALTGITIPEAEALVKERDKKPFTDPAQFTAQLPHGTVVEGPYSIASSYFIVSVKVELGRALRETEGLIERNGAPGVAIPSRILWHRVPPMKIIFDDENDDKENDEP